MRKNIFFILVTVFIPFFINSTVINLNFTELLSNSNENQGKIFLRHIKDSRKTNRVLYSDSNQIGIERDQFGIPEKEIESSENIYEVLNDVISYSLKKAGYDLINDYGKHPILDIEILDFWTDGFLEYTITSDIKIILLTSDGKKILFEKLLSSTSTFRDVGIGEAGNFEIQMSEAFKRVLNKIELYCYDLFKSNEFIKSYKTNTTNNDDLTFLSYKNQKLKNIPDNIKNPENVGYLTFFNNEIERIENLDNYKSLKILDLNFNDIKEINNLNNLSNLEYLSISGNGPIIIGDLSSLKKMKYLELANNDINELNLNNMQNLKYAFLSQSIIQKINNIQNLPNLEYLELSFNRIKKIENIDSLDKLKYLSFYHNIINEVDNLNNLKNLEYLSLQNNNIKKINDIKLPKLQTLVLSGNQIRKLENLNNLPELKTLYLSYTDINKIENLNMQKLEILYLNSTPIKKIENLDGLINLKNLYLYDTEIKRLENLDNIKNLEVLHIANTKITKLENLGNLIKLKKIYAYNLKELKKISITSDIPNIELLDLSGSGITSIEGLDKLDTLKYLYLGNSEINKIKNLDNLTNLETLNLASTKITKLENLNSLVNLKSLNVANNEIDLLENLENLKSLKYLYINNKLTYRITKPSYELLKSNNCEINGVPFRQFEKGNDLKIIEKQSGNNNAKVTTSKKLEEEKKAKQVKVSISKDENDLLKICDEDGNAFAYFSRYKNKEIDFADNVKVFDENKKEIMKIEIKSHHQFSEIVFMEADNNIGKIIIKGNFTYDGEYFKNSDYLIERFFSLTQNEKNVYYKNNPVVISKNIMGQLNSDTLEIRVDKDYLANNKTEAGVWIVSLIVITSIGQ